ncbi:MAG TPA: glycosyl hydrolase [Thermoanaerobaculia bacterium]|nr:glycosyl hydrolase [Thermoanaerobaculia bacterium]
MTPKRLYLTVFFALGWLLAIGVAFQFGLASAVGAAYRRAASRLDWISQRASDAEGAALTSVRQNARRDYLEPMKPTLESVAALKNPPKILFGAYDGGFPHDTSGFAKLETQVRYRFPIISFYSAWGDQPDQQFPVRMVETIDRLGSVPMITWEPWVTDFDNRLRPNLPSKADREYASLAAIAKGEYDFYVSPWAEAAARFGKPMFLRFAHEMNDPYRYPWGPQNGNRPDDFIAAWRRVHDIFQKKGATNVIWVWSPHISMPWFEYYYPGDHVVDWVGMGILNYGTVASWSRWWSLHQILDKAYPTLAKFNKPMMIAEMGTLAQGGDVLVWYQQAFYQLEHTYGRVRSIIFFNQPNDVTMSSYPLNWTVGQDPRAAEFVAKELARLSAQ